MRRGVPAVDVRANAGDERLELELIVVAPVWHEKAVSDVEPARSDVGVGKYRCGRRVPVDADASGVGKYRLRGHDRRE